MDVGVAAAVESLPILRVQDKSKQVRYCLGSEIGGFGGGEMEGARQRLKWKNYVTTDPQRLERARARTHAMNNEGK